MALESIELAQLLAPLDGGEHGVGVDMRVDYAATSPYQKLRDARAAARAEERSRDSVGESDEPPAEGWRTVFSVAQQALSTQTKDLEVAAWLTEALVRLHGLPGLTAGATLIAGLCDAFWDAGFPLPDEDGLESRAVPIGGLSGSSADGTIMQPLRRLPLFRRTDGSGFGLYQWQHAETTAGLPEERRAARIAAGTPELKTLEAEARLDKVYLSGVWQQVSVALQAWRELDRVVDTRFGPEAPSLRKVTSLLQDMLDVVTRLGGAPSAASQEAASQETAGAAGPTGEGGSAKPETGSTRGALLTRDDALRELDRIAEYFRRTEPHSPLAYTLEEAVRRGRMSLADLLKEVLPDDETRNAMMYRLGMRVDVA